MIYTYIVDSCSLTGVTDVSISYDSGDCQKSYRIFFDSAGSAFSYVIGEAKLACFSRYRDFLLHCKKCHELDGSASRSITIDQAFDFLFKTLSGLWNKDFHIMCKNIHALSSRLHSIMPEPDHPHFLSLSNDLTDILDFARAHMDFCFQMFLSPRSPQGVAALV